MPDTADGPRLRAWQRWSDWPLTVVAALFLAGYAVRVLYVSAPAELRRFLDAMTWTTWALFVVDYLARLCLARRHVRYALHHPLDFLVVVLPFLRPLRALRVLTAITIVNRQVVLSVRGKVGVYASGVLLLVGFCASLAVLDAERGVPGATITTFPGAMWWTLTTLTTVGYGDLYPISAEGRLVAAALMIGGIALLGVISGIIASWFVDRTENIRAGVERQVRELEELRLQLRDAVERLGDVGGRDVPVRDEADLACHRHGQHAALRE